MPYNRNSKTRKTSQTGRKALTPEEEYRRSIAAARSRIAGETFEQQIETSLRWHETHGLLKATKTPEPMKPIRPLNGGQFIACYTKRAQVDFSGTMAGGRSVRFEAKQTDSDRFERKRLTDEQMDDLRGHEKIGALCFVILCFGFDHFYRVPWSLWENMKQEYGRQYVTEDDVQRFRLPYVAGIIKILDGILDINEAAAPLSLPDVCVVYGQYAGESSHVCPTCRKEGKR